MDELVATLKEQIIECLGLEDIAPGDIDPQAPLFGESLGLDSIDALELVVMVEKYHSIKINDMEVGKKAFFSVKSLAEFIKKQRAS